MGKVKRAYYEGKLPRKASKPKRAKPTNPYRKPTFWKRGSFKDTQTNRKGVIRKAYFYGRWLGWKEGASGSRARYRVPERGGTLGNAINTKFNNGYTEGFNQGRQARKSSFKRPKKTRKGRPLGKNGEAWPKKPITRGLTAEDVAIYKYGSASPSNVAAVKRNMGGLLRPTTPSAKRAALYDARKARGPDQAAKVASKAGRRPKSTKAPLFNRKSRTPRQDGQTWTHNGVKVHSRQVGPKEWTHQARINGKNVAIRSANVQGIHRDATVTMLHLRRGDIESRRN